MSECFLKNKWEMIQEITKSERRNNTKSQKEETQFAFFFFFSFLFFLFSEEVQHDVLENW